MSSDAIVDILTFVDTGLASMDCMNAPVPGETAPIILLTTGTDKLYSDADFALFHTITGYRLATRMGIWVVVDDEGNRAQAADRLFTALSQEGFRLADLQRKAGRFADDDLTLDDVIATLGALQRAASQVGSRGLHAVRRLEARLDEMKHGPAIAASEIQAEMLVEMSAG